MTSKHTTYWIRYLRFNQVVKKMIEWVGHKRPLLNLYKFGHLNQLGNLNQLLGERGR